MNCSQISRLVMSHLPLKQRSLSLKIISTDLLGSRCFFLPDTTKKYHFSQVSCRQWTVKALANHRNLNSLLLRDTAYFNLSVTSCLTSFIHWRSMSNIPPGSTDRQNQDSAAGKSTEVSKESTEVDKTEAEVKKDGSVKEEVGDGSEATKKLTLYQRFKKTYKEHGKILVAVHLLTSAVWFGSFYTVAKCGVDIVSFMEKWNFNEKIISPFRSGSLGDIAVAYLMYKLATPARYTVTIGGTNLAIRYLRKEGKIPHVPQEDTIRNLYQEGKEHFKRRSRVHWRRLGKRQRIKSRIVHTKEKH